MAPGTLHPVGFWTPPAAGGDTVDLQNATCNETDEFGGTASARIYCYSSAFATREGECWYDLDGVRTYLNDVITPTSNADNYQLKWESLSGDAPNSNVVAENTWHALSSGNFYIGWSTPSDSFRTGSATVSIREGTGSVLDTAVWDGDVESTPPEKGK